VQNIQNQQEHKVTAERAKIESGSRPADKGKPKKDPNSKKNSNSRSSKITDNATKSIQRETGRKRGLGYTESENPVKRQKFPVKEGHQARASDTPADIDSRMEEAGTSSLILSLFLC
jgi:hypothetical protein